MKETVIDTGFPLVVDLDGTLVNTDILYEGLLILCKRNIFRFFYSFLWLLKGKAYFKSRVFKEVSIPAELLPYNDDLLVWLREQKKEGRRLILATATPQWIANEIISIHPIFSEAYGSDEGNNLKGRSKARRLVEKFGDGQFDYVGNSAADLKIFRVARHSYLVNAGPLVGRLARKVSRVQQTWNFRQGRLKNYLRSMRVHQWLKNLLIFVPWLTSHSFYALRPFLTIVTAFVAFCLVASAGYIVNDLLDLNADRIHPRKQFRPLASGSVSIPEGLMLAVCLLIAGSTLGGQLSGFFLAITAFYLISSLSYSFFLKRIVLYDVFTLAVLYSTRVFAGGIALQLSLSFWLIAFSTFIFLSLAFLKRYSELLQADERGRLEHRGRGYIVEDIHLVQTMGVASGFLAVIVFFLYIDSPEVRLLYAQPKLLWVIGLMFLFWISRIWMVAVRGNMTDDPIVFTIRDWISYILFLFVCLVILLSMWTPKLFVHGYH